MSLLVTPTMALSRAKFEHLKVLEYMPKDKYSSTDHLPRVVINSEFVLNMDDGLVALYGWLHVRLPAHQPLLL